MAGRPGKNTGDEDGLGGPHPMQSPVSPPGTAATTTPAPSARLLDVYVITGKRKPVKTDLHIDLAKPWPATVEHDGATFHFSNADLVDKTATFTNVPLDWH